MSDRHHATEVERCPEVVEQLDSDTRVVEGGGNATARSGPPILTFQVVQPACVSATDSAAVVRGVKGDRQKPPPFAQRARLGHCLRCASRLVYTDERVRDGADAVILVRFPECGVRETVVVPARSAARLSLAEARVRDDLLGVAHALGEVSVGDRRDPPPWV